MNQMLDSEKTKRLGANAWTGGQYSLYRALFGFYLLIHFASLLPRRSAIIAALIAAAALLAICFAAGWRDRIAAVGICCVLAVLHGRNPLYANASLLVVVWLLLAHCALPGKPYGSIAARGRVDPSGGWHLPGPIFAAAWVVLAVWYSYSGFTKLASPSSMDGTALALAGFELLFAPLALVSMLRPWLWLGMLSVQLGFMALAALPDLSFGIVVLHLFTFNPAWVRPERGRATVFYDGHCGLCHGAVRFLLAEDRAGILRFAALESETFQTSVPEHIRKTLPDSMVALTETGTVLVRSDGVLHCAKRLGGYWRLLAAVVALVPRAIRDTGYDWIAAVRVRVWGRKADVCPLLPPALRSRFLA